MLCLCLFVTEHNTTPPHCVQHAFNMRSATWSFHGRQFLLVFMTVVLYVFFVFRVVPLLCSHRWVHLMVGPAILVIMIRSTSLFVNFTCTIHAYVTSDDTCAVLQQSHGNYCTLAQETLYADAWESKRSRQSSSHDSVIFAHLINYEYSRQQYIHVAAGVQCWMCTVLDNVPVCSVRCQRMHSLSIHTAQLQQKCRWIQWCTSEYF